MSAEATDHRRTLLTGIAIGLITALLWGSWAVVSRIGVTGALDFWDMSAIRFLVAGVVLLPVIIRRGIDASGLAGVPWRFAIPMCMGAGVPYTLLVFAGLQSAPAGHQAVIGPAGVLLFSVAMSWMFLREPIGRAGVIGLALIAGGVIAQGWDGLFGGGEIGRGHLLFVLAALLWSTFTVTARAGRVSALLATAIVSFASMITYGLAYLAVAGHRLIAAPWTEVLFQGVFQGFLTAIIALILYTRTIELLGASRTALFTALVPGLGNLIAWPVLGEVPSIAGFVGIALCSFGMAVAIASRTVGPGRAAAVSGQAAGVLPGSKPPGA